MTKPRTPASQHASPTGTGSPPPDPRFLQRLRDAVVDETHRLYGTRLTPGFPQRTFTAPVGERHAAIVRGGSDVPRSDGHRAAGAVLLTCVIAVLAVTALSLWQYAGVTTTITTITKTPPDGVAAAGNSSGKASSPARRIPAEPTTPGPGSLPSADLTAAADKENRTRPADERQRNPVPHKTGTQFVAIVRPLRVVGPEGAVCVSYDDLDHHATGGNVGSVGPRSGHAGPAIMETSPMPAVIRELNGRRVRIRGFMVPDFQDELNSFMLARHNDPCCFGRNPRARDLIRVALRDGKTTRFISGRPFDVVGVFRVAPESAPAAFSLEDAIVLARH